VWHEAWSGDKHTVDVQMVRLRHNLGSPSACALTVRGAGMVGTSVGGTR